MTSAELMPTVGGAIGGAVGLVLLSKVIRSFMIDVPEQSVVLVTRFGKLVATFNKPGLQWWPSRIMPWVTTQTVSIARDFRKMENLHVNDARGTTVLVDLWVEIRVVDAARALFAVDEWDKALTTLVAQAATSVLGTREFAQMLRDRTELGEILQREVSAETERWGVHVESAFLKNISLKPEVSHQMFGAVAARLEHARALIDEEGRLEVAKLEAQTAEAVAKLVGDAKSQYPLAIGDAYRALDAQPQVRQAYDALFELSQLRPTRTVAFRGFAPGEMRSVDAAMIVQTPPQA